MLLKVIIRTAIYFTTNLTTLDLAIILNILKHWNCVLVILTKILLKKYQILGCNPDTINHCKLRLYHLKFKSIKVSECFSVVDFLKQFKIFCAYDILCKIFICLYDLRVLSCIHGVLEFYLNVLLNWDLNKAIVMLVKVRYESLKMTSPPTTSDLRRWISVDIRVLINIMSMSSTSFGLLSSIYSIHTNTPALQHFSPNFDAITQRISLFDKNFNILGFLQLVNHVEGDKGKEGGNTASPESAHKTLESAIQESPASEHLIRSKLYPFFKKKII